MTGQLLRVRNGFELVGSNHYFGRCGRTNTRNRGNPLEQLFQAVILLDEFIDLFVSHSQVCFDSL